MRNEQEVNRAVEEYSDMIRRLCMIHLKNYADTEDIFQTVFLKYVLSSVVRARPCFTLWSFSLFRKTKL